MLWQKHQYIFFLQKHEFDSQILTANKIFPFNIIFWFIDNLSKQHAGILNHKASFKNILPSFSKYLEISSTLQVSFFIRCHCFAQQQCLLQTNSEQNKGPIPSFQTKNKTPFKNPRLSHTQQPYTPPAKNIPYPTTIGGNNPPKPFTSFFEQDFSQKARQFLQLLPKKHSVTSRLQSYSLFSYYSLNINRQRAIKSIKCIFWRRIAQ